MLCDPPNNIPKPPSRANTRRLMYHTHTANWCYNNGNLWDLRDYYVAFFVKSQIFFYFLYWTLSRHRYRIGSHCGRGIMVARQLPKLKTRVRFPSPAPRLKHLKSGIICRIFLFDTQETAMQPMYCNSNIFLLGTLEK